MGGWPRAQRELHLPFQPRQGDFAQDALAPHVAIVAGLQRAIAEFRQVAGGRRRLRPAHQAAGVHVDPAGKRIDGPRPAHRVPALRRDGRRDQVDQRVEIRHRGPARERPKPPRNRRRPSRSSGPGRRCGADRPGRRSTSPGPRFGRRRGPGPERSPPAPDPAPPAAESPWPAPRPGQIRRHPDGARIRPWTSPGPWASSRNCRRMPAPSQTLRRPKTRLDTDMKATPGRRSPRCSQPMPFKMAYWEPQSQATLPIALPQLPLVVTSRLPRRLHEPRRRRGFEIRADSRPSARWQAACHRRMINENCNVLPAHPACGRHC